MPPQVTDVNNVRFKVVSALDPSTFVEVFPEAAQGLEFVLRRAKVQPDVFEAVDACFAALRASSAEFVLPSSAAVAAAAQLSILFTGRPQVPGNQAAPVVAWWAVLKSAGYEVPDAPVPVKMQEVSVPKGAWGLFTEMTRRTACSGDLLFHAAEVSSAYKSTKGADPAVMSLSVGAVDYCRQQVEGWVAAAVSPRAQDDGSVVDGAGVPAPQVPAILDLRKAFGAS